MKKPTAIARITHDVSTGSGLQAWFNQLCKAIDSWGKAFVHIGEVIDSMMPTGVYSDANYNSWNQCMNEQKPFGFSDTACTRFVSAYLTFTKLVND